MKHLIINRHTRVVARLVAGWAFMLLGVLGLFLPVLQGILFIVIGIALLSKHVRMFRKLKIGIYRRFPRLRHQVQHAHHWWHHRHERRAAKKATA